MLTGCGVTSSVGRTSAVACAAIRAGLTRPRPLRDLMALDGDSQELVPLVGHPVEPLTEGFSKLGRWLQLARGCLAEVAALSAGPAETGKEVVLFLVTRRLDGEYLDEDLPPEGMAAHVDRELMAPLCEDLGLPCQAADRRLIARGSAGTAEALAEAAALLVERRYRRALVLAVDSWMDPTLIAEATRTRRLKTDANPMGFMPGEAAVALALERKDDAARAGRTALAAIDRTVVRKATSPPLESPEVTGLLLSEAIEEAVAGAGEVGDLFLDLTGEEWRARQWGTALVRLAPRLTIGRTHLPALSVGDVGAASGALGVCLAAQAFARRWARGSRALVVSSSEWGDLAGMSLTEPAP